MEPADIAYPYEFDAAIRRKSRELAKRYLPLNLGSSASGAVLLLVLAAGGYAERYAVALSHLSLQLSVAVFASSAISLFFMVEMLFSYLRFRVKRSFGISTQRAGGWLQDQAKGYIATLVLGVAAMEALFLLISRLPGFWWLAAATLYVAVNFAYSTLFPLLFAKFFYRITPLSDAEQLKRLGDILRKAGLDRLQIYTMNESSRTRSVNAFVTGLGRRKRVVVYDNLLQNFAPQEIDSIVAHELGHYVRRDTAQSTLIGIAGAYVTSLMLYLSVGLVRSWGLIYSPADPSLMLWFALAAGIFGFAVSPLMNAYSRGREALADLFSLKTTRDADAFISSEKRLCDANMMEEHVSRLRKLFFATHPSTLERIGMAEKWRDSGGI